MNLLISLIFAAALYATGLLAARLVVYLKTGNPRNYDVTSALTCVLWGLYHYLTH